MRLSSSNSISSSAIRSLCLSMYLSLSLSLSISVTSLPWANIYTWSMLDVFSKGGHSCVLFDGNLELNTSFMTTTCPYTHTRTHAHTNTHTHTHTHTHTSARPSVVTFFLTFIFKNLRWRM